MRLIRVRKRTFQACQNSPPQYQVPQRLFAHASTASRVVPPCTSVQDATATRPYLGCGIIESQEDAIHENDANHGRVEPRSRYHMLCPSPARPDVSLWFDGIGPRLMLHVYFHSKVVGCGLSFAAAGALTRVCTTAAPLEHGRTCATHTFAIMNGRRAAERIDTPNRFLVLVINASPGLNPPHFPGSPQQQTGGTTDDTYGRDCLLYWTCPRAPSRA